jgi:hypothetical protein
LTKFDGANRALLLRDTKAVRAAFVKMVDYHNSKTTTMLSNWDRYRDVQRTAGYIALMELITQFGNACQKRIDDYGKLLEMDRIEDKKAIIMDICLTYNALFGIYASYDIDLYEYEISLVNYYYDYLVATLDLGPISYRMIVDTSCGTWRKCSQLMIKLSNDERTPEHKKTEWNKLSVRMKNIMQRS